MPKFSISICLAALSLASVASLNTAAYAQQTLILDFSSSVPGTIQDAVGNGTGLTVRLPGTGSSLPSDDPNLNLDTADGELVVTSTNSDLNGQYQLDGGEYLGSSLADLGFTGQENFKVQITVLNTQYSEDYDQFGIYIGTDSAHVFRTGWSILDNKRIAISVDNNGGFDSRGIFNGSLAPVPGDNVVLTVARMNGNYSVNISNLTNPQRSGRLPVQQPLFLESATNLYVGIFAANAQNNDPKVNILDKYLVRVE
jgi:regulation of enolase protein 1 (concanavalin A-like superfamily)